jgi:hypothetical protein
MTTQIGVPFLAVNIHNEDETLAVDAALEHCAAGPFNCTLHYIVDGHWLINQYADCNWSYVRRKLIGLFSVTDYSILCLINLGILVEQQNGNVDEISV